MALSNKGGITATQDESNSKYTNLGILINILAGALFVTHEKNMQYTTVGPRISGWLGPKISKNPDNWIF